MLPDSEQVSVGWPDSAAQTTVCVSADVIPLVLPGDRVTAARVNWAGNG